MIFSNSCFLPIFAPCSPRFLPILHQKTLFSLFASHSDPHMFEMYPRQNQGSLDFFGALFNHQRQAQSRGGRCYGNLIIAMALLLSCKLAAIGAANGLGHDHDHDEHHRQDVIEAGRRY